MKMEANRLFARLFFLINCTIGMCFTDVSVFEDFDRFFFASFAPLRWAELLPAKIAEVC